MNVCMYLCMSLDGVFQLIWYQFAFRLCFDLSSFVLVHIYNFRRSFYF